MVGRTRFRHRERGFLRRHPEGGVHRDPDSPAHDDAVPDRERRLNPTWNTGRCTMCVSGKGGVFQDAVRGHTVMIPGARGKGCEEK